MKSPWTTVVVAIVSLFVLLVAIGQVFFSGGKSLSTEVAYLYEHEENIPFEGVYLRNESIVYDNGAGILSFENPDGTKVSKNSVVARRYENENDSVYLRDIEMLKNQIAVLDSAEKLVGTDSSQLEAISLQINESHSEVVSAVLDGDFSLARTKQDSLLEAMCKREITLNGSKGYADKKASLNSEIQRLQSLISGNVQEITAGSAGYFVGNVDGYEGEIGYDDLSGLTEEKIKAITAVPKKTAPAGAVGKMISDYHWKVAAVIESENLADIVEGENVTLRVGSEAKQFEVSVVLKEMIGENKAVCVFECDRFNSMVTVGRTAMFKLVINSYGGLRVPRKALRYNDKGERGVLIENRQNLEFKKVEVIFWADDYVICKHTVYKKQENQSETEDTEPEVNTEYLSMYDIIVTEGKDLYDGKFIG